MDYRKNFIKVISELSGESVYEIKNKLKGKKILDIIERPNSIFENEEVVKKMKLLKSTITMYNVLDTIREPVVKIKSVSMAKKYHKAILKCEKEKELFVATFLDTNQNVIATEIMFEGTTNETMVYPKEILKKALATHCTDVIFAHNHPGKSNEPSYADNMITQKLVNILQPLDIKVKDHIIIGENCSYSFAQHDLIKGKDGIANYEAVYLDDELEESESWENER